MMHRIVLTVNAACYCNLSRVKRDSTWYSSTGAY